MKLLAVVEIIDKHLETTIFLDAKNAMAFYTELIQENYDNEIKSLLYVVSITEGVKFGLTDEMDKNDPFYGADILHKNIDIDIKEKVKTLKHLSVFEGFVNEDAYEYEDDTWPGDLEKIYYR